MSESTPSTRETNPNPNPPKKRRWFLLGCGGLLAVLLIIVATVAITFWWMQRPIKPVVLSPKEKQVIDAKLQKMSGGAPQNLSQTSSGSVISNRYTPGGKELRITERELNGLLNENTELGKSVRLELDSDAINAYLAVRIPQDFPVGAGKMFRARGRFRLSMTKGKEPVAMLEDVTVIGLSLPQEWLGGVKGKNFLADALSKTNSAPTWNGIKSLRVVPGAIVLEVGD
jgi:hypothetical protein